MIKNSLSYVLISPYTVAKSRTGGVLSRLLSRLDLDLVGAQMIAPDKAFAEEYAQHILQLEDSSNPWAAELLADYIRNNLGPYGGRPHRALLLLFQGDDPCKKLSDICGALYAKNRSIESVTGETIRDTYADLIFDPNDPKKVLYFEPAVLTPRSQNVADDNIKLFAKFLQTQNNIVENMSYQNPEKIERTLVIIKPDNWAHASAKPGTILDMFSRTGARIIGMKLLRMSVAQAMDFYKPLRISLKSKYAMVIGERAKAILESEFKIPLSDALPEILAKGFGSEYAEDQFQQVIEFMTGVRGDECPVEDLQKPGTVKCMVLVYEGENAVHNVREVLGPTDPTKAPGGTIRREYGSNIMVNAAHSSNSLENAGREMKIAHVDKNACGDILDLYLTL